ncbi:MAG: recombinase family protein [Nanoarchaeota archaeon]
MDENEFEKLKNENLELKKELEKLKLLRENQRKGMIQKAQKGNHVARVAFGYKMIHGNLIPAENCKEVEEIFEEFLKDKVSLTQLAKKHNFSVNGLKKILTNFTYISKIKFGGQIFDGNHPPIVSSTLFNHVQNKLESLGIGKNR